MAREAATRIYAEIVRGSARRRPRLASKSPLKEAVADWGDALSATVGKDTRREYLIYAKAHWLPRWKVVGDIDERELAEYTRDRLGRVTRSTLRKERAALNGLLRWCVEQGQLVVVPTFPELPRHATGTRQVPLRKRTVLREKEVRKLLAKLSPGVVRDYVAFAWETGLRPATIFKLRIPDHWEPGRKTISITNEIDKARFARELPISKTALAVLERVKPMKGGRLFRGRDMVLDELRERSAKAVGRRVRLYDFRHSRITLLVEAGGPLTGVQYLAGHRRLETTAKYAHAGLAAALQALAAMKAA